MTEIKFYDIKCAYLNVDVVAKNAIEYINKKTFDENVILDFNYCLLSYDLSDIFDAVIEKLKKLRGERKITIIHTYHEAYVDHLLSYFIKYSSKVKLQPGKIESLENVQAFLKSEYEINFNFVVTQNDK